MQSDERRVDDGGGAEPAAIVQPGRHDATHIRSSRTASCMHTPKFRSSSGRRSSTGHKHSCAARVTAPARCRRRRCPPGRTHEDGTAPSPAAAEAAEAVAARYNQIGTVQPDRHTEVRRVPHTDGARQWMNPAHDDDAGTTMAAALAAASSSSCWRGRRGRRAPPAAYSTATRARDRKSVTLRSPVSICTRRHGRVSGLGWHTRTKAAR